MSITECRQGLATPRFLLAFRESWRIAILLSLLSLPSMGRQDARAAESKVIVPPDAAARKYEEGRDAVRRQDYAEAIRELNECLAMGYTSPEERLGRSRSFVQRYDPNYWLGRAFMELGDEARARTHLMRSKESRLIEGWPEYSDLMLRLTLLDQREARRILAAREIRLPAPTPVPIAPVEAQARPTVSETLAATARTPTAVPEVPSPSVPALAPSATAELSANETALLKRILTALAAGNWVGADSSVRQLRALNPNLLQPDLLEAVIGGTRYLLEGRRNAELLERARRSLTSFRRRGGNRRVEVFWISPALEALFEG